MKSDKLHKLSVKIIVWLSWIAIIYTIVVQFLYRNPYAATWDQVDFAMALSRYDLMAMQPHFPGYPYFIMGGMIVHHWIKNPAAALTVFNILFYSSAIFPMYRLLRDTVSKDYGILLTAIVYTGSYCLTIVNQPMSEGAALAALWWFIWSIHFALYKKQKWVMVLPLFIFSILLGIRLSYLPFGSGLLLLIYKKWQEKQTTIKDVILYVVVAIVFQLVWVGAVAFSEGGFNGFLKLSLAFTGGHFQEWGGAVSTVGPTYFNRFKIFIIENIFWNGFSAHSVLLMALYLSLFLLFLVSKPLKAMKTNGHFHLPIILFFCYFIWAYLAQNIDKPRHILPLVGLGLWTVFLPLFSKKKSVVSVVLLMIILISQSYQATFLLKEQTTKKPAVYQSAEYLSTLQRPIMVYTWEETRVFEYLNVPYLHKRVETYEFFLHDSSYYQDWEIILTDKVVAGFKLQGINIENDLKKIAEFHSNELFDPVYNEVSLYQWKKHQGLKKNE